MNNMTMLFPPNMKESMFMRAFTTDNPPEPFETVYYLEDDEVIETPYDPSNVWDSKALADGRFYPTRKEAEAQL